jgi:hypothetical protein
LPADLGFYDLRVPEVRDLQAELAINAGLGGFAYYHYWFNGRRLLEHPVEEILRTKKPDFPFLLHGLTRTGLGNGTVVTKRFS